MSENYEEVLNRFGISDLGFMNQKKVKEEMAKALLFLENEKDDTRRYARSLETQIKDYKSDLSEIERDNYAGLERISHWEDEKKDTHFVGVKTKHDKELYFAGCSPYDRNNVNEIENLRKENLTLKERNKILIRDNEKKKKERDRAFSRAVSAEKKLESYMVSQGYYVEGEGQIETLPFKLEAGDRCVAEVRADHGKVMLCKNKNTAWFFRCGDLFVEDMNLEETKKKGIEVSPDQKISMRYQIDDDYYEGLYVLRKKLG